MSIAHLLEEFGKTASGETVETSDVSLEETRLAAFDKGYQAGWDDAVKAQSEEARRITADLAQNLQDLRFTYEEAFAAVMQALRPLLTEMAAAVLPRLARESLAPRLAEMLQDLARSEGRRTIEIAAAPADMARLSRLIEGLPDPGATLAEDDTLGAGQLYLRFGETEHEIDLPAVIAGIDAAVTGFFEETQTDKTGKAIA